MLDITWVAATSPDGTSPITGYTVTSTPGSFTCTTTGATTCNVSGLTSKTAYTFTVTATNQYGTSAASAASGSISAGFPGVPTAVTVLDCSEQRRRSHHHPDGNVEHGLEDLHRQHPPHGRHHR